MQEQTQEPIYTDAKGLRRLFGICRTTAYSLIRLGKIKSVSVCKPGAKKGKRLFEVASVKAFLSGEGASDGR